MPHVFTGSPWLHRAGQLIRQADVDQGASSSQEERQTTNGLEWRLGLGRGHWSAAWMHPAGEFLLTHAVHTSDTHLVARVDAEGPKQKEEAEEAVDG